jgi:predicted DCC family thiol-disulfide oxidoreductase YuxK
VAETIFYDGDCGLCHRWVRFVIAHDPGGETFTFSPLQGQTIRSVLTDQQRQSLPDSVVVLTAEGEVLVRTRAVLHILRRLGGGWRTLAWLGRLIPPPLFDPLYGLVARLRHRLSAKPSDACPLPAPTLRDRFRP